VTFSPDYIKPKNLKDVNIFFVKKNVKNASQLILKKGRNTNGKFFYIYTLFFVKKKTAPVLQKFDHSRTNKPRCIIKPKGDGTGQKFC